MAKRTPYQYTRGMERIGFHPRNEEEEYEDDPLCLGVGAAHAVSEIEEEETEVSYPRLALFFQIVTSDWGAGLAQGALIVALVWLVSSCL